MNIPERLTQNKTPFILSGRNYSIVCPFKKEVDTAGEPLATFNIDSETGYGSCGYCGQSAEFDQIIKELGIKDEVNSLGVINIDNSFESLPASQSSQILTIGEILSREYGDEEWLIDRILPMPGILALSGIPGGFKTWITHSIAIAVARGAPVFGEFIAKQGSVFFIDEENNPGLIKQRFASLNASADDLIYFLSLTSFKIEKKGSVEMILAEMEKRSAKLVVIDSLIRIHGKEENSASEMAIVFEQLKKFPKAGISVIFTHHHRKGQVGRSNSSESLRGSSDILAAVDAHISVEKSQQSDDVLVLRMHKSRYAATIPSIEVRIIKQEKNVTGFEYIGNHDERATKAAEAAGVIIDLLTDGVKSRPEIHDLLAGQFNKTAIDDGIKNAGLEGKIERVPKKELTPDQAQFSKRAYYRLAPKEVDEIGAEGLFE